jgi:SPP1 gp7 family putative phage head morphogenesis protein
MSKFLKPIRQTAKQEKRLEDKVLKVITDILFKPIIKFLKETKLELLNDKSVVKEALLSGKIYFENNIFRGDINAQISKELKSYGAKFDHRMKAWRINIKLLPIDIRMAIVQAESEFKKINEELVLILDNINTTQELNEVEFTDIYLKDIKEIDKQLKKTVYDVIGIEVNITDKQRVIIAREFSENLKLTIKNFLDKEILTLRKEVEKNVFRGFRADSLADIIQKRYGVSKSKAKFLGLQETSLLTSKYRELRYKEVGITTYKWSTSKDERVRDDHDDLDGKVFSFDNPPIVNKRTGKRANPGEDFGCRCVPIPIIVNIDEKE